MQCSKRHLSTKGSKQALLKRLHSSQDPPSPIPFNDIQERITLLQNPSPAPTATHPIDSDHPEFEADLELLLSLLITPGAPVSNATSMKKFFEIASPPIRSLAARHGLIHDNQLVPNAPVSTLTQALRLLVKPPLPPPPPPKESLPSPSPMILTHPPLTTSITPTFQPPPGTIPDQQLPSSSPSPSTTDTPLTASLAWSCERDPIQYGLAIRTAIDFLDKHSHDYGERNLAFTKAQVENTMAAAISQDTQFDSARTQFIAHVVDFLELAASRALFLKQPNAHAIRITQKAHFLDAINELSCGLQDPHKADPTKKFLRVIILAALGRLFSPAQTAAFRRMGISLPASFFGISASAPSYITAAQQPPTPPRPPVQNPRPPPSSLRRPAPWPDRICGKHCPNAAEIIGESTPGAIIKRNTRCTCGSHQHDPFECYAQWHTKFRRPLPGFILQDHKWIKDPTMWNGNNISPALARIWLAVIASGKCTETPYGPASRRTSPDFNAIASG